MRLTFAKMARYDRCMAKPLLPRAAARPALLARAIACAGLLIALLLTPDVARANWLSKVMGAAEHAGTRSGRLGLGALDNAAAHVKALPAMAERPALAAQATQEGHWRFVNKAGETFTCTATDRAGTHEKVTVRQLDDKGNVRCTTAVLQGNLCPT